MFDSFEIQCSNDPLRFLLESSHRISSVYLFTENDTLPLQCDTKKKHCQNVPAETKNDVVDIQFDLDAKMCFVAHRG